MKNVVMGVRIKTRDMQNVVKANFIEGVAETKAKQKIKFSFCSTSIVGNKDYTIELLAIVREFNLMNIIAICSTKT